MITRPKKYRRALWTKMAAAGSGKAPNGFTAEPRKPKRLRPRSRGYEAKMKIYRRDRLAFLAKHPWCEVFKTLRSETIHHVRGRLGDLLLDQRFWRAVSLKGHRWIDSHREWARTLGLLAERGQWNKPPQ